MISGAPAEGDVEFWISERISYKRGHSKIYIKPTREGRKSLVADAGIHVCMASSSASSSSSTITLLRSSILYDISTRDQQTIIANIPLFVVIFVRTLPP